MPLRVTGIRNWFVVAGIIVLALVTLSVLVWRDDIARTLLDPKVPFQTYDPPPAPLYAQREAWALLPTRPEAPGAREPDADIFFIAPTTYHGGREWNAPYDDPRADRVFQRVMAPNYAGPFVRVGRIFAPRYRQASLYALMTLREDARDARRFAYADVVAAFRHYRDHYNQGRPIVLVGVEQGGVLASRLLSEEIAPDPVLRARLAVAYLVETAAPAGGPIPACTRRGQPGCLAAWASAVEGDGVRRQMRFDRAVIWTAGGDLEPLAGSPALCFNPLLGAASDKLAPARLGQGAANATGLEWAARPAFMSREVSAQCEKGVLKVSEPKSSSLKPSGSWVERHRAPGYNLFYADLEADAKARVNALLADPAFPKPAAALEAPTLRRID